MNKRKSILYNVSFMLLVDAIGYGIVFPILPQLLFNEHTGLILGQLSHRAYFYSLTLAIYPIASFFGVSFFGSMSDKYGRKLCLLSGLSALVVSYFLSTFAIIMHSFALFFVARALSGFLGGIYSVGNAIASDVSGPNEKNRFINFRLPILANQLGVTIGPALSIFVVANSFFNNEFVLPYLITTLLGCLNIIILVYGFRNVSNQTSKNSTGYLNQFKWIQLFEATYIILKRKKTRLLAISFLIFQWGAGLLIQALSLYLTIEYNDTPAQIGFFTSIMGLFLILSTYSLPKILSKYFDCSIQLKILLSFLIGVFLCAFFIQSTSYYIIPNNSSIMRTWIFFGIFYLLFPVINLIFETLFSESANKDEQGLIMGALGQMVSLSRIFSALFVGLVILYHLIVLISGLTFILSFWLFILYSQRKIIKN